MSNCFDIITASFHLYQLTELIVCSLFKSFGYIGVIHIGIIVNNTYKSMHPNRKFCLNLWFSTRRTGAHWGGLRKLPRGPQDDNNNLIIDYCLKYTRLTILLDNTRSPCQSQSGLGQKFETMMLCYQCIILLGEK